MKLDHLRAFLRVAELGSMSRAADLMDVPKSRLSRQIRRLETDLHVLLLRRTTRSQALTREGRFLLDACRPALAAIEDACAEVRDIRARPQGKLRVTTTNELAQYLSTNLVQAFIRAYPQITVELESSQTVRDLIKEDFDLAIRAGNKVGDELNRRTIGRARFVLAGSVEWATKSARSRSPAVIERLPFVLRKPRGGDGRIVLHKDADTLVLNPRHVVLQTTNFYAVRQALLTGTGVGLVPRFLIADDLQGKRLHDLLPGWCSEPVDISIVYPNRRFLPKKVRAFIDHAVGMQQRGELEF
jgi:DNA-binding transcriptional LysR family regulator